MSFQLGNHRINPPSGSPGSVSYHQQSPGPSVAVMQQHNPMLFMQQKRPSSSTDPLGGNLDKNKRARLDQPTIDAVFFKRDQTSVQNLTA